MSAIRVHDIDIRVVQRPDPGTAADSRIKGQSMTHLLRDLVAVSVRSEDGVVGESLSMGGGAGLAHYLASTLKPMLLGRDVADREAVWTEMWTNDRLWFTPQFAIGTMDVALWDLYGKTHGLGIHELLGTYRTRMPTYASSMTKAHTQEFVDEALACRERGYQGYKLHVVGAPDADIGACQAVRAAVGDDYPLMMDVVAGYNDMQALRVGRALEELGYHWFEEPLSDYNLHGYRRLAQALDIPIAGVESNEGSLYSMAEYITSGAVDIVRADASFKHGVGQTKKIAALAEAFGLNLEMHTNTNPLMDAVSLHIACSIGNTEFFEQLVPEQLFDFGVEAPIHIDEEGYAHVPDGPGHGVALDREVIDRYTVATL